MQCGFASGFLSSSAVSPRGSPIVTAGLFTLHSTAAHQHSGYALAPPSLGSTGHIRPNGFSGPPRLSGSALISRHPCNTFGFVWLLLPLCSTFILGPTGSASVLRSSGSTSDARRHGSTSVSWASGLVWAHRTSCSSGVSISGCFLVGHPQGVSHRVVDTMVPPSSDSALGPHLGWSLDHLAPAPGPPLAPPSFHAPLDFPHLLDWSLF
ncbi:uncharacterized protein [Pseudorasbora parva]|uniref:uncharacterized protein n=1 Tax=Pseudorasbora parva TaxID=51549 RepID=UPI00351DEB86